MHSAALSTTNPLQTCLEHAYLGPFPTKRNPQQVENSVDANKPAVASFNMPATQRYPL